METVLGTRPGDYADRENVRLVRDGAVKVDSVTRCPSVSP